MEQTITTQGPVLHRDHGFYAAISVTNTLTEAKKFFSDPANVEKVLKDLPEGITNFLDLEAESLTGESLVYRNRGNLADGTLTFHLKEDSYHGGTIITADAKLAKISFGEEGPSTLMNTFMKRMKNLLETGEVPTTKGQPSGREEIKH